MLCGRCILEGQDNSRYGVVKTYVEMAVRLLEGCTTTDRSRRAGIKPSTYTPINKLGPRILHADTKGAQDE